MNIDESKPLVNGNADGNGHHFQKKIRGRCGWILCNAITVVVIVMAIGYYASQLSNPSRRDQSSFVPPPPPPPPFTPSEPVQKTVMYRPFCLTHGKATARVLQTSMGTPSQQWAHIPCYDETLESLQWSLGFPQPTQQQQQNIPINAYGAPDAILRINTSQYAFPTRESPIIGFGAAFTEAAALNYETLSPRGKEVFMELVYGKSGLGYALGRVHINSCDFSIKSYSFDDTDGDFELQNFDVEVSHDYRVGMIDMILRATSVFNTDWRSTDGVDGNFKMYASPWSPPAWMKAPTWNDKPNAEHAQNMTGSAQPTCLRDGVGPASQYAKAWALYFSKFITACKSF